MAAKKSEKTSPYGWLSHRQNLEVLFASVRKDENRPEVQEIQELLVKSDFSEQKHLPSFAEQWALLNGIELRLFRLLDRAALREETLRKFDSAARVEPPLAGLADRKQRFEEAAKANTDEGDAECRAIAAALLEDLFVIYSYRFSDREKRREVSQRLTWMGLAVIGIPTLLVFLVPIIAWLMPSNLVDPIGAETFQDFHGAWRSYLAFFVVMYFGAVGAYFSRLFVFARDLRLLKWNELDTIYSRNALWVRLLAGAIAAVILFFLMMGEVLSGALFLEPAFELWVMDIGPPTPGEDFEEIVPFRPTEDFARLVVWCTLAGFSERFLPDRLGDMETRPTVPPDGKGPGTTV